MGITVFSPLGCLTIPHFSTLSLKRQDVTEYEKCALVFSTTIELSEV
jgi:hypothetical protein